MGKIIIVGLGPGNYESLTLKTLDIIKKAKCLVLRTEKHPLVEKLKDYGINFYSCDNIYDSSESFEEVYERISLWILDLARENEDVVYAVPGHPFAAERSVQLIIEKSKGLAEVHIESAMSFIDVVASALKIDICTGLKIIDGLRLDVQKPDVSCGNIITQTYSKFVASEVKLKLMDYYNYDQKICIIRGAGVEGTQKLEWIELYELDRIEWVDYLTSLYIPPSLENKKHKTMEDLLSIMEVLRSDNGCPWDKKQNHKTLKPYLLEECYEVIDAIDDEDIDLLIEELGDVLLQVVFHAQIGKEDGEFDINDVIMKLVDKLILRHPHVFGNMPAPDEMVALSNWEASKRGEKGIGTYSETLINVPKAMSSLTRSYKVQEKAALSGFDWDDVNGAMDFSGYTDMALGVV